MYNKKISLPSLTFKPIELIIAVLIITISAGLLITPYYKYAFAPGLLAFVLFLFSVYPQTGYYLILFLIPFSAYTGTGFFSISKFTGIWIFLIVLIQLLLRKRNTSSIKSNIWPLLAALFLISLISAILSVYPTTSFDNVRKLITAYTVFTLTLALVHKKGFCLTFPKVIIWSVAITSFLTTFAYIFDIKFFAMGVEGDDIKRGMGAAGDPNLFCSIVLFSLPFLFHFFFSPQKLLVKSFIFAAIIMCLCTVILSFSRSGAMVAALLLLFICIEYMGSFKAQHLGLFSLTVIITVIIAIIFVPPEYWDRMKTITKTHADTSVGRRFSYLIMGWDAIKEHPVIGCGPGTFRDFYSLSAYAAQYTTELKHYWRSAHNSYLEIFVGTGALGFLSFLLLVLLAFRNFSKAKKHFKLKNNGLMASLTTAYRLSFVSMLLYYGMLGDIYHKYLWSSFALSQIAFNLSIKDNGNDRYNK